MRTRIGSTPAQGGSSGVWGIDEVAAHSASEDWPQRTSNVLIVNQDVDDALLSASVASVDGSTVTIADQSTSSPYFGSSWAGNRVLVMSLVGATTGDFKVFSVTDVAGSVLTLDAAVDVKFAGGQVVLVPSVSSFRLEAGCTIRPVPFNGARGGVFALWAESGIDIAGVIDASQLGFGWEWAHYGYSEDYGYDGAGSPGGGNQFPGGMGARVSDRSMPGPERPGRGLGYLGMGTAGGRGYINHGPPSDTQPGGRGGGAIALFCQTLGAAGGSLRANGQGGQRVNAGGWTGGAGGGAGGTIYLQCTALAGLGDNFASATGGGGAGTQNGTSADSGADGAIDGAGDGGLGNAGAGGAAFGPNGGGGAGHAGVGGDATATEGGHSGDGNSAAAGGGGGGGYIIIDGPSGATYPTTYPDVTVPA